MSQPLRHLIAADGAGTILAFSVFATAASLLVGLLWVSQFSKKQIEAQQLADTVALAADDALRGKTSQPPCTVAEEISSKALAKLDTCRIVENKVLIELHLYIGLGFSTNLEPLSLKASAAAEPIG